MALSDGNRSESPLQLPELSPTQGSVTPSLPPVSSPSAYGAAVPITPLPPGLAAPPDMMSLLKALKRHWLLATTLGLLAATIASAAAWYLMPVKYNGEVLIRISTTKLVQMDNEGVSPFSPLTLATIPKTRGFLQKVLDEPNIANLPSLREQLQPIEWLRRGLTVTYLSPELMSITLSGTNPPELVALLDAVGGSTPTS